MRTRFDKIIWNDFERPQGDPKGGGQGAEISIPHAWESMFVSWARKHKVGVVCGFAHRIVVFL